MLPRPLTAPPAVFVTPPTVLPRVSVSPPRRPPSMIERVLIDGSAMGDGGNWTYCCLGTFCIREYWRDLSCG